jgi:hypothetical protein
MRVIVAIALLVLLVMHSGLAIAQTTEQCQPTPRAGDLLDCYNGNSPPLALAKPVTSKASSARNKPAAPKAPVAVDKPEASKTPTDHRAQVDDILEGENQKLDAKVKTLCRGC